MPEREKSEKSIRSTLEDIKQSVEEKKAARDPKIPFSKRFVYGLKIEIEKEKTESESP